MNGSARANDKWCSFVPMPVTSRHGVRSDCCLPASCSETPCPKSLPVNRRRFSLGHSYVRLTFSGRPRNRAGVTWLSGEGLHSQRGRGQRVRNTGNHSEAAATAGQVTLRRVDRREPAANGRAPARCCYRSRPAISPGTRRLCASHLDRGKRGGGAGRPLAAQ
jgi:hypothetical protein